MLFDWGVNNTGSVTSHTSKVFRLAADMFAEEAQLFAGRLRGAGSAVSAPDALLAFAAKVRLLGRDVAGLNGLIGIDESPECNVEVVAAGGELIN